MFSSIDEQLGLPAGEAELLSGWSDADDVDELALLVTVDEWNAGWGDSERHLLPDLASFPPGPLLAAIV